MARAISSFPEPVSPCTRTVESVGATVSTCFRTRRRASLCPTISFEAQLAPDLVLEVDLLLGEPVPELGDLAVGEGVVERRRDLAGDLADQVHLVPRRTPRPPAS